MAIFNTVYGGTGGGGGWQPGANTIAYYPLDSTNTVNDMKGSGTAYNLINKNILFGTYQGVDCAYFNSSNSTSGLYYSGNTQIIPNSSFTWLCWIYKIDNSNANPRLLSSYNGNTYGILLTDNGTKIVCFSASISTGYTMGNGSWNLWAISGSFNNSSFTLYKDGGQVKTWSGSNYNNGTGLTIGGPDAQGSTSSTTDKFNGYMSKLIIEDKIRTAEEISDYFDKTKGDYGL